MINFNQIENVAKITFNRPDKLNSFVRKMALEFQEKLDYCATKKDIRAIMITGSGKSFCAGQDLQEVIDVNGPGLDRIVKEHYNPAILKIRNIEKPVISAVNGVAAGAGANLALACDVVVACKSASFIQAFSKIGLIPDSGGTFFLPRIVGWQKASALMMTGEKIVAERAEKMGMIYKVFSDEEFENSSIILAKQLSQMPTKGLGLTKKLLNKSLYNSLDKQLNLEDELQTVAGKTYDYKEGVQSFLEKRKPIFKGE